MGTDTHLTGTSADESEIALEPAKPAAESNCNLVRDGEQRETRKFCHHLSSKSHPLKKAPGHPDPGVTVPEPSETPPPSVCAGLPDGCGAPPGL